MIVTALSGSSGLPATSFNTSSMEIDVGDITVPGRRLRGQSRTATATVKMTGRTSAESLKYNGQNIGTSVIQFKSLIANALNGTPSTSASVLKKRFVGGGGRRLEAESSSEKQDSGLI